MDIDTHLRFGYDTYGLRQLIANLAAGDASHIVSDITDGFYVNSDSYFKMAGAMGAEWGASVLNVFPVDISGGFYTQNSGLDPVHVYIEDPNADGKLRFDEFHVGLDNKPAAFKLTGELAAELNVEVGFPDPDPLDVFPAPPNKKMTVAREVLIRFATLTPSRLSSEPDANGEVTLFLGTNAHQRAVGQNHDDGDEKFIIEHLRTNSNGSEDIKVRAFGINQVVRNIRKIKATDQVGTLNIIVQPGVTSDVDFDGGQGAAFLTYLGTGIADLTGGVLASELTGGSGPSILTGRAGNDTIILGSDVNTVNAGGGNNTVIAKAPIRKNSVISGGIGGHNFLKVIASPTTTAITATPLGNTINLGIQNGVSQSLVTLNFSNFDDVFINASFSPTGFRLGDLAAAGVTLLTLDVQSRYPTARSIDLDSRVNNGPSIVGIRDYVYQVPDPEQPGVPIDKHGAQIVNTTTGLTTRLLGFHSDDMLTLRHHGGSITVDALQIDGGHFVFDNSSRVGNVSDHIQILLPSRINGRAEIFERARDVQMTYSSFSSFRVKGSRVGDQLNVDVSAPTSGATTIDVDAMSVQGELNLRMLGGPLAVNHVTLRKSGLDADVSIIGQNTTTELLLGVGQLSAIRHDVFASNVKLTVDNDESTLASILTLDATSFGMWKIPTLSGVTPRLTFSNLRNLMTVYAGAGDRFQLDVSPSSISGLVMHNASLTNQDSVYTSNWSVPLDLVGNFSFYAGQVLHRDGKVERVKRLTNVQSSLTLKYSGNLPSEVFFDGDLDSPGAEYEITGTNSSITPALLNYPTNTVFNETVGLKVEVSGYSADDRFCVYMPGATVNTNLRVGPDARFYFDGQARLAGTNPTAPNDITILARAGSTTMTPLGQYNSLLDMYNDVYVLGALPQDNLDVTQPTEFKMASTLTGTNQIRFDYSLSGQSGFTVTSPTARYTVHSTVAQLPINPLNPNPAEVVPQPISPITSFVDRAIMYQDLTRSSLESQIVEIRGNTIPWTFNVGGTFVTIPVEVIVKLQIYEPNPNPIATNNHVNIDASQLRGTFGFHVSEPDYTYAELLADGLLRGSAPPATNFGQSYVTISKTNPQLTTTIFGTTPTNAFHFDRLVRFTSGGTVSRWAGKQVTVGAGDLCTLQGNLTVNQAWLKEVDNRNAALANITQLTAAGVSWGAGDGGRTSLTLNNLQGKLTVTGSPLDRFAVEGTPNSAYRTILRNFSTAATPSGAYVMGKNVMPLEVSGNFDFAVGRRLNLDGTVTSVGTILDAFDDAKNYVNTGSAVFPPSNLSAVWQDFALLPTTNSIAGPIDWSNSGYLTSLVGSGQPKPPLPIYYDYSGPGQGTFVFDASNETVTDRVLGDMIVQAGGALFNGISSNSNYVGKANFRFYESEVIYGSNTNVYWYGAKLRTNTNAFDVMAPTLFNNVLNGAVHYFANSANVGQNPIEQILVGNTLGPVYIEGSGRNSRVEVNPLFSLPTSLAMSIFDTSINNQNATIGSHPGWGVAHTGGYSLIDTI